MDPLNFFAVILKVFLVNLLAALNFANVFKNTKNVWKIKKTLKTGKNTSMPVTRFLGHPEVCIPTASRSVHPL